MRRARLLAALSAPALSVVALLSLESTPAIPTGALAQSGVGPPVNVSEAVDQQNAITEAFIHEQLRLERERQEQELAAAAAAAAARANTNTESQARVRQRRQPTPTRRAAPSPRRTRSGGGDLAKIRRCESGGNYQAVSESGKYRGAYQFDQRTWESVGGSGDPAAASPEEQDARAAKLQSQRGNSPWPNCG